MSPRKTQGSTPPAASATAKPRSKGGGRQRAAYHDADLAARAANARLVIVESPAKARTIGKFLGSGYVVTASVGHVRDLPKDLGVDVEHDFAPHYVVSDGKTSVVSAIKAAARQAAEVYLATDPDREGEAISWHIVQAAQIPGPVRRVVFHEITPEAIADSFAHPRPLDMQLVDAYQARRVLDRLVGYEVSEVLWRKVRRGLSAGRVQSVAVRLVVDREREIEAFVPVEYWTIHADLEKVSDGGRFRAGLVSLWGVKDKLEIPDQATAEALVAELKGARYQVAAVREREQRRQPAPPFTTSTLQQEAARKLRFSAKHTMAVAQQLYEGLAIGSEGAVGLITYMRTDSVNVAASAQQEALDYIGQKYGPEFKPDKPRLFSKKAKGAQEAHEAIRPTAVKRDPASLQKHLNRDQFRLYELIWQRFVASQMAAAILDTTSVDVRATAQREFLLRASGSRVRFPGFLRVYEESRDDEPEADDRQTLPPLTAGDLLKLLKLDPQQHFTEPPPRYSEATLVKTLEENGIGRPSTYAQVMSTIQERNYVELRERRFYPTELGRAVTDYLVGHFGAIVDVNFTAQMEEELDEVARGERRWVPMLRDFYGPFHRTVEQTRATGERVRLQGEPTDEICAECGRPMVIKQGRYGRFLSCTGYPECKAARPLGAKGAPAKPTAPPEPTGEACPNCGKPMVKRSGRYGEFIACSGYPKCKTSKPVPLGVKCPECHTGDLVEKRYRGRSFYGCSNYPACRFTTQNRPLPGFCRVCEGMLVEKNGEAVCNACGAVQAPRAEPLAAAGSAS